MEKQSPQGWRDWSQPRSCRSHLSLLPLGEASLVADLASQFMPLPFLSAATLMSVVIATPVLWCSGCGDPRPALPESLKGTSCVIRGTGGLQESLAALKIT